MSRSALDAYSRRTTTNEERDRLVQDYLPLVQHVVSRLTIRVPQGLERSDLFEVGCLGLINAAQTYCASKGASFKTHAYVNIRGAILDEIRRHDPVPRSRRDRMRQISQISRELQEKFGRAATPEEIAAIAKLSVEQVEEALISAHGVAVLSLEDSTSAKGEDGPLRLVDCLRLATSPDPHDEASNRERLEQLSQAILELPERERRVIALYYANDLRLKEIGEVMGITESRVSQLHARALYRLGKSIESSEKAGGGAREELGHQSISSVGAD